VVHRPLPITLSPPQQYLLLLETEAAAAAAATASLLPRSSAEDLVQTSVELSTELETQVQIRFECTNPSPPDLEETAAEQDVILEEETRQERQREGGEAISLSLSLPRPTTKFSNGETHSLDAAAGAEGKQASLSTNHSTPFPNSTNQNTPLRSRVSLSIQSCSIRNQLAFSPDVCPPGDPAGPELSRKNFFPPPQQITKRFLFPLLLFSFREIYFD